MLWRAPERWDNGSLFAPFPILGVTFFAWASFLPILMDFCVFGPICWWIFMISWRCFLRTPLHSLRQYSAMNRQGSARNRQDSDQFLPIHQRQEWSAAVFALANRISPVLHGCAPARLNPIPSHDLWRYNCHQYHAPCYEYRYRRFGIPVGLPKLPIFRVCARRRYKSILRIEMCSKIIIFIHILWHLCQQSMQQVAISL